MTKDKQISISIPETTDSPENMAELLRSIATMIDEGYTSGYYPHWKIESESE